jgi:hypothetical protein
LHGTAADGGYFTLALTNAKHLTMSPFSAARFAPTMIEVKSLMLRRCLFVSVRSVAFSFLALSSRDLRPPAFGGTVRRLVRAMKEALRNYVVVSLQTLLRISHQLNGDGNAPL